MGNRLLYELGLVNAVESIFEVELDESGAAKTFLEECAGRDEVILLYGAGDREVNHAVVLERILTELAN